MTTEYVLCSEALQRENIRFHARTADAVACLELGYAMMLCFFRSMGMLHDDMEQKHREVFHGMMLSLAAKQAAYVESDKPTHIFIRKLMGLLDAGK